MRALHLTALLLCLTATAAHADATSQGTLPVANAPLIAADEAGDNSGTGTPDGDNAGTGSSTKTASPS